jgi:GntR family transcriptional regulator
VGGAVPGDKKEAAEPSATVERTFAPPPANTQMSYSEQIMDRDWNDSQPIYRQVRDRVVAMILDGALNEGDPLPSVRNVAQEYRVNPLTVMKGYQQLVDEQLVESRRGRGMFINTGARKLLLQGERQKFLNEDWPKIVATIQRLGLEPGELLSAPQASQESKER